MNDCFSELYGNVYFAESLPHWFVDWDNRSSSDTMKIIVSWMKKRLKFIHITYSRFKNRLKIYYSWIWCKKKDLYNYEEEDS